MKRWPWLIVGLLLGFGLALLIGRVLLPIQYYDTAPAALRADYRDEYLRLVALAYRVENDLALARRRLEALAPEAPTAPLVELAERWSAQGRAAWLISPLAELAHDLGVATPALEPYVQRGAP